MTASPTGTTPTLALAHGIAIPQLGLGTWPMAGEAAAQAVASALALGYRLIDTAENYGNEEAVGQGIRASGVPRDQVFLTTKFNKRWHGRTAVREACAASLRRLGTDYLDLLLIHWPNPDQGRYVEAFAGLQDLIAAGLIRAAGVSNFKPAHLEALFAAGLSPDINQIQLDPCRQRRADVACHRAHGIVTETWSPLDRNGSLLREPAVASIAAALGRSPAQVVLRWHIQKGYVTVPKSADPARQASNLDIFGFALDMEQMAALDGLNRADAAILDSDVFGH